VGFEGDHPGHFGLNTMGEWATQPGGDSRSRVELRAGMKIRAIIPATAPTTD
jgi:hypothetical protein